MLQRHDANLIQNGSPDLGQKLKNSQPWEVFFTIWTWRGAEFLPPSAKVHVLVKVKKTSEKLTIQLATHETLRGPLFPTCPKPRWSIRLAYDLIRATLRVEPATGFLRLTSSVSYRESTASILHGLVHIKEKALFLKWPHPFKR